MTPKKPSDKCLVDAVSKGKHEVVEALLKAKANPNVFNSKRGVSMVCLAVSSKRADILRALIAAGAALDVQNKDPFGLTPLIVSSWNGYLECAVELIEAKANVNQRNKFYPQTALMVASREGHLEIVEALLAAKADTDLQDKRGETALLRSCSRGYPKITAALIGAGAGVNLPDNFNRTPVWWASRGGRLDCVQILINAKCCVLTPQNDGQTPIYEASINGHLELIRALLKANADAQTPNKVGSTPLHIAAANGRDDAIKVLVIEGQAQLRVVDNKGKRPLECAELESSTRALLTEMELTGADEHVLIKSATKRFRPLVLDE